MLRKLEEKDIPYMLEWMHDDLINCCFRYPFANMTYEKAKDFIRCSFTEENQHFAIADIHDEYLGTISLKNISPTDNNAEYAIVTRKKAHGTGIAQKATVKILQYAFHELKLHRIYLNVLSENIAAKKLYEKCGFHFEGEAKDAIRINGRYQSLAWYAIINSLEKYGENKNQ